MNSPPILDEIQVKEYDFDDHSFHTHAQQRDQGSAGIIINPPEEAAGTNFNPFNVEDRDFQINILPPTPLELFQLFVPISLVQSWVYYSDSWVSYLMQNGIIDSHSSAISNPGLPSDQINNQIYQSIQSIQIKYGILTDQSIQTQASVHLIYLISL